MVRHSRIVVGGRLGGHRGGFLGAIAVFAFLALLALPGSVGQAVITFQPSPHTRMCFLDFDGSGVRASDEPLYLNINSCSAGTSAGDVRLTSNAGFVGGTIVRGSDDDAGRPGVTPASVSYAFFDNSGDGSYNSGDELFVHFGALPGTVIPGDVALTGPTAYQSISGNDTRLGRPLGAVAVAVGNESYGEIDGNGGYTTGDRVYLDLDGSGAPSAGDLRLADGTASVQATTTSSSTTSTPPLHPFDPTVAPVPDDSAANSSTGSPDTTRGAPGSIAVATLALLIALRRRD